MPCQTLLPNWNFRYDSPHTNFDKFCNHAQKSSWRGAQKSSWRGAQKSSWRGLNDLHAKTFRHASFSRTPPLVPPDHACRSTARSLSVRAGCAEKCKFSRRMRYCKTKGIRGDQGRPRADQGGPRWIIGRSSDIAPSYHSWRSVKRPFGSFYWTPWGKPDLASDLRSRGWSRLPTPLPPSHTLTIHRKHIGPQRPHTYNRHLIQLDTPRLSSFGKTRLNYRRIDIFPLLAQ